MMSQSGALIRASLLFCFDEIVKGLIVWNRS